jgi:hypothetical protein
MNPSGYKQEANGRKAHWAVIVWSCSQRQNPLDLEVSSSCQSQFFRAEFVSLPEVGFLNRFSE